MRIFLAAGQYVDLHSNNTYLLHVNDNSHEIDRTELVRIISAERVNQQPIYEPKGAFSWPTNLPLSTNNTSHAASSSGSAPQD